MSKVSFRRYAMRCVLLLALLSAASCSREVSASDARQSADEFAKTHYSLDDHRLIDVTTVEKPAEWVVTYSAKGQALGGPVIIGVDKKSGRARLIEGAQ